MGHLDSQRSLPVVGADKTGFSPLAKKLRLALGHSVLVLNAPEGYMERLRPGPVDVMAGAQPSRSYDVVVLFVSSQDELRRLGPGAIRATKPDGLLWVTYPMGGKAR